MKDLAIQTPCPLLQAPLVETAAPEDGLLPANDLDQPLRVTINPWREVSTTQTCQLIWNGIPVGTPTPVSAHQTDTPLTLLLPGEMLSEEGKNELCYRVHDTLGEYSIDSPITPILIDRTPPGGELLAALILPCIATRGLTSSELTELGNQLTAIVPGYFDMQWGDVIDTYWGEQVGPTYTVQADEPGSDKVRISVERNFLEQLGNGEYAVSYRIRDRAGNVSIRSQPASLRLHLQQLPARLCAPVAKPLLLNVRVSYLCISRHGDGPARVSYQVCRNGETFTSPDLRLEGRRKRWSTKPWRPR